MDIGSYLDLITTDFINISPEDILKAFDKFTLGSMAYQFPPRVNRALDIFRGIKWKKPILPHQISECSFNPNPLDFGRCHIPGHPVFYGSNKADLVPPEINATEGDIIVLGKWELNLTTDIRIANMLYGLNITNVDLQNYNRLIDDAIIEAYDGREGSQKAIEDFKLWMKVFNNIFISNNLKLAGTIAHNMMYQDKVFIGRKVQCLMYSPIRRHGYGINYAIDGRLCTGEKTYMIAKRFYALQIGPYDYEKDVHLFNPLFIGNVNSDNINWELFNIDKHKQALAEAKFAFH